LHAARVIEPETPGSLPLITVRRGRRSGEHHDLKYTLSLPAARSP
jgi:hypothetical protein